MPQPTPYDRITNFQNDQALHPVDPYPAPLVDAEYNAIKITTDEILQNLALIQRDDGQLANDSVGIDQIKDEVLLGFGPPLPWVTNHHYFVHNTVFHNDAFYLCLIEHTSNLFETDLAAGKWSLIVDFAAATAEAEAAAAAAAASAAAAANSAAAASAAQGAFRWNFDSSTAMADPGVGDVRGNGSPASAMTQIAISAQTADAGNPNILTWILTWDDSTNPTSRGTIYIRKVSAPENFAVFNLTGVVTNNGTWAQIGVTYITHSGVLAPGEPVSVAFSRTGNQGVTGPGSGDMLAANNLSDVANTTTARNNLQAVFKGGDTMSGDLAIDKVTPGIILKKTSNTSQASYIQGNLGATPRWQVLLGIGNAETGNNVGSDFAINRFSDNGTFIGEALNINRATGVVSVGGAPVSTLDAMAYNGMQINGSFDVSQERGTTPFVPPPDTTKYVCDGWLISLGGLPGPVVTCQQVIGGGFIPGLPNVLLGTVTTAKPALATTDVAALQTRIEGYRAARLGFGASGAKPVTISFWTAHHRVGTYSVSIRNISGAQSCVMTYAQSAADTWEYK
jgi:hypothetical protein